MAPYTNIGLALGVAPDGCIHFGSLEFTDSDGPGPVPCLLPGQALRFGDLDFIGNRLGQLCLHEGDAALPHIPTLDHGPTHVGPVIIDSDALACRINAYLGMNP